MNSTSRKALKLSLQISLMMQLMIQFLLFSDGSKHAYGTVAYCCFTTLSGNYETYHHGQK